MKQWPKRLWFQLSLMISLVLFLVFFLQFASIMLEPDAAIQNAPEGTTGRMPPGMEPREEIARRLIYFIGLSVVVGFGGGILISRVISRPVSELANAAHRIGKGDLDARVKAGGSLEIRDLAETFNRMASDLQQAEKLRSSLMADVSHELRTPLTVLEGNLRATLDQIYRLDEAEVANLYGQVRHLTRLVNDLHELALAESNRLPLEKQTVYLPALVSETLQTLEPLADEKNIRLESRMEALPQVEADPFRLRQVLYNLLVNALRHTPPDGSITVVGELRDQHIHLCVRDTGEGLSADEQEAVFGRFYRADKSRSRETGGTGLGLAIVKAIIESHGGQVTAYSAGKGLGSEFTIVLTAAEEGLGSSKP